MERMSLVFFKSKLHTLSVSVLISNNLSDLSNFKINANRCFTAKVNSSLAKSNLFLVGSFIFPSRGATMTPGTESTMAAQVSSVMFHRLEFLVWQVSHERVNSI